MSQVTRTLQQSLRYSVGLGLIAGLIGCSQTNDLARQLEATSKAKRTAPGKQQPTALPSPKVMTLPVTVNAPTDLKVKEQMSVVKGQVIVDPATERQGILKRLQALQGNLTRLNALAPTLNAQTATQASPERVQQAQARLQAADAEIAKFKKDSPYTDYALANLPLPEVQLQLEQLNAKRRAAQVVLEQEKARLAQAKTQASQKGQGLAQLQAERGRLLQEKQQLEKQLASLKTVYSPYTGLVQKVKPVSTKDSFKYELTIAAQAVPQTPSAALPNSGTLPSLPPTGGAELPPLPSAPSLPSDGSGLFLPPPAGSELPQLNPGLPPQTPPSTTSPR